MNKLNIFEIKTQFSTLFLLTNFVGLKLSLHQWLLFAICVPCRQLFAPLFYSNILNFAPLAICLASVRNADLLERLARLWRLLFVGMRLDSVLPVRLLYLFLAGIFWHSQVRCGDNPTSIVCTSASANY